MERTVFVGIASRQCTKCFKVKLYREFPEGIDWCSSCENIQFLDSDSLDDLENFEFEEEDDYEADLKDRWQDDLNNAFREMME